MSNCSEFLPEDPPPEISPFNKFLGIFLPVVTWIYVGGCTIVYLRERKKSSFLKSKLGDMEYFQNSNLAF